MSDKFAALQELDNALVAVAKKIRVLGRLAWPVDIEASFLADLRRGDPKLPQVPLPKNKFSVQKRTLKDIIARCDAQHPVEQYIQRTALSYLHAAEMIEAAGTPRFTERSIALYGRPTDTIGHGPLTHLQIADIFIQESAPYASFTHPVALPPLLTVDEVKKKLSRSLRQIFTDRNIKVKIDPSLLAKACAGANIVRLRSNTLFTEADVTQLLAHECFVHTLTAINGREQPWIRSLGLGAPRTTRAQEGLAVFSELVSHTMDVSRLRRIALRTKAIQFALDGANFIDVFRFFLEHGQEQSEAFQSSARIFRGGVAEGSVCFTKDVCYLAGFSDVHTFLVLSVLEGKAHFPRYLFSGRLTPQDIVELEPFFVEGLITEPQYEPPWLKGHSELMTFLLYSSVVNRMELQGFALKDFALSPA